MKKILIILSMMFIIIINYTKIYANDEVVMQIGNNKFYLNGVEKNIDENIKIVPLIKQNRTILPIRAIIENLGGNVFWDDSNGTIQINYCNTKMILTIGSNIVNIDGVEKEMEVKPCIINGRTMLPLRFISESFGIKVEWDDLEHKIKLIRSDSYIYVESFDLLLTDQIDVITDKVDIKGISICKNNVKKVMCVVENSEVSKYEIKEKNNWSFNNVKLKGGKNKISLVVSDNSNNEYKKEFTLNYNENDELTKVYLLSKNKYNRDFDKIIPLKNKQKYYLGISSKPKQKMFSILSLEKDNIIEKFNKSLHENFEFSENRFFTTDVESDGDDELVTIQCNVENSINNINLNMYSIDDNKEYTMNITYSKEEVAYEKYEIDFNEELKKNENIVEYLVNLLDQKHYLPKDKTEEEVENSPEFEEKRWLRYNMNPSGNSIFTKWYYGYDLNGNVINDNDKFSIGDRVFAFLNNCIIELDYQNEQHRLIFVPNAFNRKIEDYKIIDNTIFLKGRLLSSIEYLKIDIDSMNIIELSDDEKGIFN